MAQITFVDGDVLTASQLNTYCSHEGGAWTSYTPQIDQGASTNIAKTVDYSKYARAGRMITWNFKLTLSASGTAGSNITVTFPVAPTSGTSVIGTGWVYDTSTTTPYVCVVTATGTTNAIFIHDTSTFAAWGTVPNLALATGDVIQGSITYEAAS